MGKVVDCVEVDLFHPLRKWVVCDYGGGVVECHRRHCMPFGVDKAVLYYWHCLWASGGRSKFLEEWASLRNRMVVLWACFGPSLMAQLLIH